MTIVDAETVGKSDLVVIRAGARDAATPGRADVITTEVIRQALGSVARRMKQTLVRTAFSPVIYEVLDFAAAMYDDRVRLLAEAPSLPIFMGTMSFCVEEAVAGVGGPDVLRDGDVILYNSPYGTGSHAQDCAVVMPVFLGGKEIVGYAAIKGHLLDIGGKDPYSTDTVDVFQEGTIFPGVWLYRGGELVRDVYRMLLANTRVPDMVAGDISAEVAGVRAGASALVALIERFGLDVFRDCVERMYDHGESLVRECLERIPDGRYVGRGRMDNNGVDDDEIPFEVTVEVKGSDVTVDFSAAPDAQTGPMNCPIASTVSGARIAIAMLAGGADDSPNEGHFRPLEVIARRGSMFYPESPSPCFLYGWPADQSIEAIYQAIAQAVPTMVPACSGGDICGMVWWGNREATGEPWVDGSAHPIGHGGHSRGDGASSVIHTSEAASRFTPVEVWEQRNPWRLDRVELAADSAGAGRHRGGLGVDFAFRMLEDSYLTAAVERTRNAPWGLQGGGSGRPNSVTVIYPDGQRVSRGKLTRQPLPKGTLVELRTGGGGGYGDPGVRDPAAVAADLREGYITESRAREDYGHSDGDRG
ncbi:MAG: hydantoinase B/oxoprolinase family protein [Solirubrobacteraceae bacterium]